MYMLMLAFCGSLDSFLVLEARKYSLLSTLAAISVYIYIFMYVYTSISVCLCPSTFLFLRWLVEVVGGSFGISPLRPFLMCSLS